MNFLKRNDGEFGLVTNQSVQKIREEDISSQWIPAIVLDIILSDEHPQFKKLSGVISSPKSQPPDYRGDSPSEEDLDYQSIGSVLVRFCSSHEKIEKENLIWARPIDTSHSKYPLLNEVVLVIKIFDKYYYTCSVNTTAMCNVSADFRYEPTYGKKSHVVEEDKPISKLDSSTPSNPSFNGNLGDYFLFNKDIRFLRRYEGDVVVEGRFGNSIRLGAYDSNRKNDIPEQSTLDDKFGIGNPMVLIRNRQRPLSKISEQIVHPLLPTIPSISGSLNEKNVAGYILEDINHDGSSIQMTSGKTQSSFKTTCYKRVFSENSEEQPKYSPPGSTSFKFPILDGDQIVINSDRLVLSSRQNESLFFSKKRFSFTTDSEFIVDSHDKIVLNTNVKTVINSPAIYLGQFDATTEPALLGQTTVNWLYDLCNWLLSHTHWYKHSHVHSGEASPDKSQIPVEVARLIQLRDSLHKLLSRRVFLTGGGFEPGLDGNSIENGVSPTKIDVNTGNGVPGGWRGTNRL